MESLHYGKILGEDRTNIGFCWEIATGIYYANLGERGARWMGMRSRAPPVADAARRSIRSGRKKSSKRAARRFFRAPQGGGGKYAVATFGAHLCAVRICFSRLLREKQYSYPAQLSVKGVCKGESLVPLCPVLLPFAGAKGRPPRRAVLTMPLQKAPPRR